MDKLVSELEQSLNELGISLETLEKQDGFSLEDMTNVAMNFIINEANENLETCSCEINGN